MWYWLYNKVCNALRHHCHPQSVELPMKCNDGSTKNIVASASTVYAYLPTTLVVQVEHSIGCVCVCVCVCVDNKYFERNDKLPSTYIFCMLVRLDIVYVTFEGQS